MLLGSNKSIEDIIVEQISQKSQTAQDIWKNLKIQRTKVTIQAVYKSIRKLLNDGVILKTNHKISLNQEWISKISKLLQTNTQKIKLNNGESITYKFKGLSELDKYWKHILINYINELKGPIFHCEPHEIWIHIDDRLESQKAYLNTFKEEQRFGFIVFGSNTFMDKEYKKKYQNEFLSIDLQINPSLIKRNQYITIIDDIVITTTLKASLSKEIDAIYETTTSNDLQFKDRIQASFIKSGIVKLKIEKSDKKAKRLRKRLSKNFFIHKKLIEEFNLF